MSHKRRGVKEFIVFVIGAFFLTMGIMGFLFSCLPFNFFMAILERYFINVVSFSQKTFPLFLIRLRVLSVIFCSLAAAVFIMKKNLISYSGALSGSLASAMRSWLVELKRFISIEDKLHLYSLLAIMLSGAIVRFFYLFQPMRYDEAQTHIFYASKPIYFALSCFSFSDHLLNTLLIFITTRLFGSEPWSIRLPAFFAGILIIPAAYLVARIFYNKNAALLTAALVASSVPLILYSTNGRGYTLLCLFFLLLVAVSHQLKRTNSPALWFFFVIFAVLGFYAIPTMLYAFGAVFTWLLLSVFRRNIEVEKKVFIKHLFLYSLAMFVVVFLLYSPVLVVANWRQQGARLNVYLGPLPYPEFFSSILLRVRELSIQWSRGIPFLIQVFIIIGLSVSVVF